MPYVLPLELDKPPIDETMLAEIGRIMVLWAWFEDNMHSDIMTLLRIAHKSQLDVNLPPQMPYSFNKRLNLWRRLGLAVYVNVPHYTRLVGDIHDGATRISRHRNVIVHGTLEGWGQPENGTLNWANIEIKNSATTITKYQFDLPYFKAMSRSIEQLIEGIATLSMNAMIGTHRIKETQS